MPDELDYWPRNVAEVDAMLGVPLDDYDDEDEWNEAVDRAIDELRKEPDDAES